MGRAHVIGRTEKVKQLRDLLKETQIVYISSFFYSGKTMLLNQLAQSQNGPVLFFSAGQDDWPAFVRAAKEHPDALLIVDDLQYLSLSEKQGRSAAAITEKQSGSAGNVAGSKDMNTAAGAAEERSGCAWNMRDRQDADNCFFPENRSRAGGQTKRRSDKDTITLRAFLAALPRKQRIVMAGRGKRPMELQALIMTGAAEILDKDFVMFTEEETEQLFLEYGVELIPQDIAWLVEVTWGTPFVLQAIARKKEKCPERSVQAIVPEVFDNIEKLLISDILPAFSEEEKELMFKLSPFDSFEDEMARDVTGLINAPALIRGINERSYLIFQQSRDGYRFVPIVQKALFNEMKNLYPGEFIDGLYERAARYYEQKGLISRAIYFYKELKNIQKIRELLLEDTYLRPADGDSVELREAYAMLPEEMIKASPELMKGMCMIESLLGRSEESERWYREISQFIKNTSSEDPRRQTAWEAVVYLDIALPHRGTENILRCLNNYAGLCDSGQYRNRDRGFNTAGNSVSFLNGGKDFSHWVPLGQKITGIVGPPLEKALGSVGKGVCDILTGECGLESSLNGDYRDPLEKVTAGLSRVPGDLEVRCAGIGIQSRILMAEGEADEGIRLMNSLMEDLPLNAPVRLRENLQVHRMTLQLMKGETREPLNWLEMEAPDETRDLIVLDRYKQLLKLRLYIITAQWEKTRLLTIKFANYCDQYNRPYMRIKLHLLQAIIDRRTGTGSWKQKMETAVSMAKRFSLVRVIADEGIGVLDMLREMELPDAPWEKSVLRLTRLHAANYPTYMRSAVSRPAFTGREQEVYALLVAGYKNAQIASILALSERTVKHYATKVYQKLGVRTRAEAISRAAELGDVSR